MSAGERRSGLAETQWPAPKTVSEYHRLRELLETLILKVGDDENHPQAAFLDRLGELIEEFEASHLPEILEAEAAHRCEPKAGP
jgi:hypothetical protein